MNLYFSHHIFSIQRHGGISRYYVELARELHQCTKDPQNLQIKVVAPLFVNAYLPKLPASLVIGKQISPFKRGHRVLAAVNQSISIPYLATKTGIYHETYYNSFSALWAAPLSSFVKVTTVHDCIHEIFPKEFSWRDQTSKLKKATLEKADLIFCVSNATKNDLLRLFDVDPKKIRVTHLGAPLVHTKASLPNEENRPTRPYFLFVGRRGIYKNGNRLIHGFANSLARREDFLLVFFGGEPVSNEERNLIFSEGLEKQIIFIQGDDDALAKYYQNAAAFVFPSLYEGFGLPILEAMSAGCPVICSNTSSFPEVARDAALYFDPTEVESITFALDKLLQDSYLRNDLIKKGFENIRNFSWAKCAELTLAAYREFF